MGKVESKAKGVVRKTLERWRSKSWRRGTSAELPREGWLAVRVGAAKERFVVRAEWLNHPLFGGLLAEAETEFGYAAAGPLELPCGVELFREVEREEAEEWLLSPRCSFAVGHAAAEYFFLNPAREPDRS
ncbi:auxin-induced protein X15-like [Curcuma longa]|uniref:auxin-induced protein X15-like n=1 Tax=Curcuma longa TaxID=136217 RepID=UPI003D9E489D